MNKKIIMSAVLLTLIGLAFFVSAYGYDSNEGIITIKINKGWNLIPLTQIDKNSYLGTSINSLDIKYGYIYDRISKEYIFVLRDGKNQPNPHDSDGVWFRGEEEIYGLRSSFWIYSEKEGDLVIPVNKNKDFLNLDTYNLKKGWNFIWITQEMVADINVLSSEDEDKYVLNAMKGNCDWTEVYSYGKDGGEMKWMDLLNNPSFMESEPLGEELAGMNLVIKVRENCYLSSTKEFEAKINPPAIPN